MTSKEKPILGNIAVLGSTGSIGIQTLDIVRSNPEKFKVVAIAGRNSAEVLISQALEFSPEVVGVVDVIAGERVSEALNGKCKVVVGEEALDSLASLPKVHTVVSAVVGFAGLKSTLTAINNGKHLALANKESLVAGGALVREALSQSKSVIVPIDSEHNSIFQCLLGKRENHGLTRIIITASGGPFWQMPRAELDSVSPSEALKHPRWNMGPKITIDSATMMNKGLEIIEAAFLFNLAPEKIDVLIHPQSLVHGLVEFEDGAMIAAISETDMRLPISFALGYLLSPEPGLSPGPRIAKNQVKKLDLAAKQNLQFFQIDEGQFPALRICYQALRMGKSAPVVLNAANEVAVEAFLQERIKFTDIASIVGEVLSRHQLREIIHYNEVVALDASARQVASDLVSKKINEKFKQIINA